MTTKSCEWILSGYPWMQGHIQSKSVVNFFDIPEMDKLKKHFEKVIKKLKPKHCFDNASIMMKFLEFHGYDVEYIEGFMFTGGMVIQHAWNSVTVGGVGYWFDITADHVMKDLRDPGVNDYSAIVFVKSFDYLKQQFKLVRKTDITLSYREINRFIVNQRGNKNEN